MAIKGKIELLNEVTLTYFTFINYKDYLAGLQTLEVAYNIKGIAEKDENELNKINAGKVLQFTENDRLLINYTYLHLLFLFNI